MPAKLTFAKGRKHALMILVAVLTWGWAWGWARGPFAQEQSSKEQQVQGTPAPVLRTATRLVEVSVVARDKKGNPATDLTAGDLVILDDGHPQKVQFFREDTNQSPTNAPVPLPPDTYTNQLEERGEVAGNVNIVLIDGLNTLVRDQAFARQQAIKFLQQIRSRDRLAIYTLGSELRVLQDFTSDSSVLTAALGKYSGHADSQVVESTPTQLQTGNASMDAMFQDVFQREANMYILYRVETTVAALIAIANHVAALPGRKNLLWVSGSFPFSVEYENLQDITAMTNNSQSETNLSNQQMLFAKDVERAARALNDADVAVYPVDARGLLGPNLNTSQGISKGPNYGGMNIGQQSGRGGNPRGGGGGGGGGIHSHVPRQQQNGQSSGAPSNPILNPDHTTFETMDALADGTGGKAFYNTNDVAASLRSAIDDSRVTYELGYYPSDVKWDGKFHSITVRVNRPGIIARARKGYFALPQPAVTADALRTAVRNAVASPLEATGMGLAVRMKGASGGNGTLGAMVFFDPRSIRFESKQGRFAANVSVLFVQLDDKNQILNSAQRSFPLDFSPGQYAQFMKQQVEFEQSIAISPKASQLRVVVWDGGSGNMGAVAIPLGKYLTTAASATGSTH